jgi:hypothetical protein
MIRELSANTSPFGINRYGNFPVGLLGGPVNGAVVYGTSAIRRKVSSFTAKGLGLQSPQTPGKPTTTTGVSPSKLGVSNVRSGAPHGWECARQVDNQRAKRGLEPWEAVVTADLDLQRAILEWRARAAAEHRSAAQAARLLHLGVVLGLDRAHIDALARTVADELDHAALALGVARALGGDDAPVDVELALLLPGPGRGPLAEALLLCLTELCVGETLAVDLFATMRAAATQPEARSALDRILRDEPRHRRWAWRHLDALLRLDPEGGRRLLNDALEGILTGFASAYADVPAALDPGATGRAAGLLSGSTWRRVFWRTWSRQLRPKLSRAGLEAPRFAARAEARGSLPPTGAVHAGT